MANFRAILNKVSEHNVQQFCEELRAHSIEDADAYAALLVSRIENEPHFAYQHLALAKCQVALLEAVRRQLSMKNVLAKEPKAITNCVKFYCLLRSEGVVDISTFVRNLKRLLNEENPEHVVAAICAIASFKLIVPNELFRDLHEHAVVLATASGKMRLEIMVEDALEKPYRLQEKPKVNRKQRITSACTAYISNIDCCATEWQLACVLRDFGQFNRIRLCGDSKQTTQYAFVEYADEQGARNAVEHDARVVVGSYPIRCSHSKSVIQDTHPSDAIIEGEMLRRGCVFGLTSDAQPQMKPIRSSENQLKPPKHKPKPRTNRRRA